MLPTDMDMVEADDFDDLEDAEPDEIAFVLQSVADIAIKALGPEAVLTIITAAIEADGREAN